MAPQPFVCAYSVDSIRGKNVSEKNVVTDRDQSCPLSSEFRGSRFSEVGNVL